MQIMCLTIYRVTYNRFYFSERGVASVGEANTTQIKAKKWLMEQSVAHGWEKNTHRAITALYLAQVDDASEEDKFEKQLTKELEIRQLELKTLVALLRFAFYILIIFHFLYLPK